MDENVPLCACCLDVAGLGIALAPRSAGVHVPIPVDFWVGF